MKKLINILTANGWNLLSSTEDSVAFELMNTRIVIYREGFDDFHVTEYDPNGTFDMTPNQTLEDIESAYCS